MLKKLILPLLFALLLASCGEPSKEDQLKNLKVQLGEIQSKIAALEEEIGTKKDEKTTPVELLSVQSSEFNRYVSIQSIVESDRNSDLSPQMGGIVTQVLVQEGDFVKEGQTIIKLDDSIQQKRLSEAKNRLEFIKTLFERQKRVWEQKAGSEIEYLKAKNDLESMEKSIQIIEQEIDMLKIKAPFSGIIDVVNTKIGQVLSPGMPAVRLTSNSGLKVKAELSESYIVNFKRGDLAEVSFPDLNIEPVKLPISSVSRSVDKKNRTINAYVNIPSNLDVQPNMICVTKLRDYHLDSAIVVPVNLVQKDLNGEYIYVAENKDGKQIASKRPIISGESYKDMVVIKNGLNPGDKVITVGSLNIKEGDVLEISQEISNDVSMK